MWMVDTLQSKMISLGVKRTATWADAEKLIKNPLEFKKLDLITCMSMRKRCLLFI